MGAVPDDLVHVRVATPRSLSALPSSFGEPSFSSLILRWLSSAFQALLDVEHDVEALTVHLFVRQHLAQLLLGEDADQRRGALPSWSVL